MSAELENRNKFKLVQEYLVNGDHFVSRQLGKIEPVIGVSKEILVNICVAVIVLVLLFAEPPAQQFVTSVVTIPFPAYCSYFSFTSENIDEFKICLLYWSFHVLFKFLIRFFYNFTQSICLHTVLLWLFTAFFSFSGSVFCYITVLLVGQSVFSFMFIITSDQLVEQIVC